MDFSGFIQIFTLEVKNVILRAELGPNSFIWHVRALRSHKNGFQSHFQKIDVFTVLKTTFLGISLKNGFLWSVGSLYVEIWSWGVISHNLAYVQGYFRPLRAKPYL